jgi:hypothetical protein
MPERDSNPRHADHDPVNVPSAIGALVLCVTVAVLLAVTCAAAASPSKSTVGGPPSIKLGPPDEGTRTSPALIIGAGSVLGHPVQIVSYGWEPEADSPPADFCVWVEQPPREIEFGTCGTSLEGARRGAIALDMDVQAVASRSARATSVGGRVSPDVATVRLYFHRRGSKRQRRVDAIVAQVGGDLQNRLKQPAPFGFFYARVRGVMPFGAFKAQTLNAEGKVIGTAGR